MKSPLENIIDWFNALPVTYRQAVAVEVAAMMPGMNPNFSNPFYHRQFIAQISEKQTDKLKEAGLVICLKALLEDVISTHLGVDEDWDTRQKELKEMAEITGSCSIAEEAFLQQAQHKQWSVISETWKAMSRQSLNDQTMGLWRKNLSAI